MPPRRDAFAMDHPIIITFLILAIIAFMSFAAEVLKPVAFAVLLSFALAPISGFLQRRGVPRALAAALTVMLALAVLAAIGYQVGQQLTTMAHKVPTYEKHLIAKLQHFRPKGDGALEKTTKALHEVSQTLLQGDNQHKPGVVDVNVVSEPSVAQRLHTVFGSTLEYLGAAVFLLILVFFLLINRENLTERLIRLVGTNRVSLTTKTMEEVDHRISRYLVMFATVNSSVGLIVGVGLHLIGVEYATLWGVLAALLRFIPYLGPGTAFLLPFLFSVASVSDSEWRQPLMVIALFGVLEILANSYLEPVIYGKTTGVSSFGLLVAALFWTWLWGALGLLLSTPLTVCLAVLGKYVPGLRAFAVLLGEDPPLTPDVQFYQRLMGMDQDGAAQILEEQFRTRPRVEVFDQVLVSALSQAKRDSARGDIDEREHTFVWRVIGDVLDDLEQTTELVLSSASEDSAMQDSEPVTSEPRNEVVILGLSADAHDESLVLRMLHILLQPHGFSLTIVDDVGTPLELVERVAEHKAELAVLSQLPPGGLTATRYLVRRIRARFSDLPLLVGRWTEAEDDVEVSNQLKSAGATQVITTLAEARDRIVKRFERANAETAGIDVSAATAPIR